MKNQLVSLLTIASFALIIQSCKKEDLNTLTTPQNNNSSEQPQSRSIQNQNNSLPYKEVDMKDLAGAMTPQNYPLNDFELLVQTEAIPTGDTTKPKIRRGIIVALGREVSPSYQVNMDISYDYTYATAVYISGNFYHKIHQNMILQIITD